MSKNPYQILHLDEDATYDEIKQRYRHLTKCLHPDKQPLQNYQATKRLFQQIDEAYKSISSPLRRYLFREYGITALKILDQVPDYFQEYDVEQLTPQQTKKLKQLMIYLLYEREASYQTDKTKFITRTVVNINKTIKGKPINAKKSSKRNLSIPQIQNCTFEYQMVLPQFLGFNNTFALSQTTTNLKVNPKSSLGLSFSSVRRILWNYMLYLQFNISNQESNLSASINRICENNLSLNFTPLSINNWKLSTPKISVQKSFQDYQISSSIDLNGDIGIDYSDSNQKTLGKSLKVFMQKGGSLGIIPKLQYQMTQTLRFFTQISLNIQSHGKQVNVRPTFIYGYKLMLNQQLKIQLSSCIGASNYLQISLATGKFRVGVPLIVNDVGLFQFEVLKVTTMVLIYGMLEGYKLKSKRDKKLKERELRENETRLNELKRELNRNLSDIQLTSQLKRQKEIRYNGLIIIRAIFGQDSKIRVIGKKISKIKFNLNPGNLQRDVSDIQQIVQNLNLKVGQIKDQAQNITSLLQNEVIGGQIMKYDLNQLRKYSPVIQSSSIPSISILYIERGQLRHSLYKCNQTISMGTKRQNFNLMKTIRYMIGYFA